MENQAEASNDCHNWRDRTEGWIIMSNTSAIQEGIENQVIYLVIAGKQDAALRAFQDGLPENANSESYQMFDYVSRLITKAHKKGEFIGELKDQ